MDSEGPLPGAGEEWLSSAALDARARDDAARVALEARVGEWRAALKACGGGPTLTRRQFHRWLVDAVEMENSLS